MDDLKRPERYDNVVGWGGCAKMQKREGANGGGLWGLCSDEEKQASPGQPE